MEINITDNGQAMDIKNKEAAKNIIQHNHGHFDNLPGFGHMSILPFCTLRRMVSEAQKKKKRNLKIFFFFKIAQFS